MAFFFSCVITLLWIWKFLSLLLFTRFSKYICTSPSSNHPSFRLLLARLVLPLPCLNRAQSLMLILLLSNTLSSSLFFFFVQTVGPPTSSFHFLVFFSSQEKLLLLPPNRSSAFHVFHSFIVIIHFALLSFPPHFSFFFTFLLFFFFAKLDRWRHHPAPGLKTPTIVYSSDLGSGKRYIVVYTEGFG